MTIAWLAAIACIALLAFLLSASKAKAPFCLHRYSVSIVR